ncbi:MAG: BolA family transcriptional regulator, partial [Methylophaga nitratireducenticrescens]
MKAADIKAMIEAGLPDADVEVFGEDGQHFDARVF